MKKRRSRAGQEGTLCQGWRLIGADRRLREHGELRANLWAWVELCVTWGLEWNDAWLWGLGGMMRDLGAWVE